jgi:hypothetical protein
MGPIVVLLAAIVPRLIEQESSERFFCLMPLSLGVVPYVSHSYIDTS